MLYFSRGDTMAISEAQKRARDTWDKKNMTVLSCKLLKDDGEAFRQYAEEQGKSVNDILKEFVFECIKKEGNG